MSEPVLRLRDNPILVAQCRRRLRRARLVPALVIIAALGTCAVLWQLTKHGLTRHADWQNVAGAILLVIGGLLYVRGTAQTAESLRDDRRSGILDFHRATPTTPWTHAVGYLLGCSVREYVLSAALLPFLLVAVLLADLSLTSAAVTVGVMIVTAWLYHAYAMWVGLSLNSRRGTAGTALFVVLLVLTAGWPSRSFATLSFLTPYRAVAQLFYADSKELSHAVLFYGILVPPALFYLVVQGSVLAFFLWAVARKLQKDGAPSLSRLGALGCYAWILFLSVGGAWRWLTGSGQGEVQRTLGNPGSSLAIYLVTATVVASLLLLAVVPSYLDFMRTLRRARRRGEAVPDWREDGGPVEPLIPLLTALFLGGLGVALWALGPRLELGRLFEKRTVLALATVPAVLAFVAGAAEYVQLQLRRSVTSFAALLLFTFMVLPWILGGILSSAGKEDVANCIYASSPGYAVAGAANALVQLFPEAAESAGQDMPLWNLVLSLALTSAEAAWFLYKAHAFKKALLARIPLGPYGQAVDALAR